MSTNPRLIILSILVFLFIVANIIAGVYKWGASSEAPDQHADQTESTVAAADEEKTDSEAIETPATPEKAVVGAAVETESAVAAADEEKTDSMVTETPAAPEKAVVEAPEERAVSKTKAEVDVSKYQTQIAALIKENAFLFSNQRTEKDKVLAARALDLENQLRSARMVSALGMAYVGLQGMDDVEDHDMPVKKRPPVAGKAEASAKVLAGHHAADVAYAIVVMPKSYLPAMKRFSRSRMARDLKILPAEIEWNNGELVAIPKQPIIKGRKVQKSNRDKCGNDSISIDNASRRDVKIGLRNTAMLLLLQRTLAQQLNYDRTN